VGALALRLWGINFGFPAIYRPDEDVVVGRAMGVLHGVLDPHFANWPHLYMYLSAAWLAALRPLFPLFGPAAPYFAVRVLDALIGTATVMLVFAVGRRAYGPASGLVAATLLAVAFLPVRDSHFATLDTPLTFACLLGIWVAIRLAETDAVRWRAAGGILLGLAASIKYNGAVLMASLATAEAIRRRAPRRVILGALGIGLLGAATFVLTSPFLIIDLSSFSNGLGYIFHHLSSASQPEIGYLHIPRLALWFGLDPPLFLLGLAGLVYAAFRRTTADWILLAFVLAYYGLIGAGHSVFVRYADPLVPPLVLLGAHALVAAGQRLMRPALAIAAAVVIVAFPGIAHDAAFDHLIQQTDTRTQAFDWLAAHVPPGSRVADLYFAGPAHDQAMIDRGDQSHGATDAYVASFLQNRLEDRYSVHDLDQADLNRDALATLRADGVAYVVYSPTTPAGGCSPKLPLLKALEAGATLRVTFSPTNGRCTNAVFDPIDGYYVPLSRYGGWVRPGPTIQIFALAPPTG
jgi:Dolichyl-phosphate-mannose-protein mannosyltransferase